MNVVGRSDAMGTPTESQSFFFESLLGKPPDLGGFEATGRELSIQHFSPEIRVIDDSMLGCRCNFGLKGLQGNGHRFAPGEKIDRDFLCGWAQKMPFHSLTGWEGT